MSYPKSVKEIMSETTKPAVALDDRGLFIFVNKAFADSYGWMEEELIGEPVTKIMPSNLRDAHTIGFSRFLTTETPRLAGKPLPLAVLYKDGSVKDAEHFILAEKIDGHWLFAATITER